MPCRSLSAKEPLIIGLFCGKRRDMAIVLLQRDMAIVSKSICDALQVSFCKRATNHRALLWKTLAKSICDDN